MARFGSVLLVCRFVVPAAQVPAFVASARRALELLPAAAGTATSYPSLLTDG